MRNAVHRRAFDSFFIDQLAQLMGFINIYKGIVSRNFSYFDTEKYIQNAFLRHLNPNFTECFNILTQHRISIRGWFYIPT